MSETEFAQLLQAALELAARHAEQRLGHPVPGRFVIRLFGGGQNGALHTPEAAAEALYLGPDRFYRIVDVAVVEVSDERTVCFMRASAHASATFAEAWNRPPGSGPFKQLVAEAITVSSPSFAAIGDSADA